MLPAFELGGGLGRGGEFVHIRLIGPREMMVESSFLAAYDSGTVVNHFFRSVGPQIHPQHGYKI